ncbi:hypothetical protein CEUSTIGMA_g7808.t1 [Chlamydomonas eustigma]|uniref:Uncharacterized protein n=1 Tax=Chlamydomonas eustigma TaxID=1157962 RepID=A0A250XBT9_9CHLO|nr:hypothetical protein CEUSTIGMA_g7808.t1 [Chlamydomonas eustigma]|eukprot:GAX80369.1 hypothetical protein CEUSTIGMA_g7808.t1 [Chlamydomonas eustigma]
MVKSATRVTHNYELSVMSRYSYTSSQHSYTCPSKHKQKVSKYSRSPLLALKLQPPVLCDESWKLSYDSWVHAAVQDPIEVTGKVHSKVHVLGITHSSPCSPRAIQEVSQAIRPDAVGLEQTDDQMPNFRKAANSMHIQNILMRMMTTPVQGIRESYGLLLSEKDLVQWELGLQQANISLGSEYDQVQHYIYGRPNQSETLAGAHIARKYGAAFIMLDDPGARDATHAATIAAHTSLMTSSSLASEEEADQDAGDKDGFISLDREIDTYDFSHSSAAQPSACSPSSPSSGEVVSCTGSHLLMQQDPHFLRSPAQPELAHSPPSASLSEEHSTCSTQVSSPNHDSASAVEEEDDVESMLRALGNSHVAECYCQWLNSVTITMPLVSLALLDSINPQQLAIYSAHLERCRSAEMNQAERVREQAMCDCILALCRGELTRGRPCTRVLVVVGKNHVTPLKRLLMVQNKQLR